MAQVEGNKHELEEILFIIALALVAIVTIFANLLVIGAFCVDKRLRKTNNFFIISLTIAGFLTGGYSIPLYIITRWTGREPLSLCKLCGFLDNALATISVWTLAMTSLDRYYMVMNYKKYTRIVTVCRAKMVLISVWIYGCIVCAPPLIGWNEYWFNPRTKTCGIRHFIDGSGHEFFLFYFFMSFPLPLFLVSFSYFWIFIQAWGVFKRREKREAENTVSLKIYDNKNGHKNGHKSLQVTNGAVKKNGSFLGHLSPNPSGNTTNARNKLKCGYKRLKRSNGTVGGMSIDKTVRATLMVFVLVITYIVCTFPIFVFSLIVYFDNNIGRQIPKITHTLTLFLFFLNSALNPIMYGVFNTNFRGTFSRLLCCNLARAVKKGTVKYARKFSRSSSSVPRQSCARKELSGQKIDDLSEEPRIRIHILSNETSSSS